MQNFFYHSAETRWFLPEPIKWDKFLRWFTRNDKIKIIQETVDYVRQPDTEPFVKQEQARSDEYLLMTDL